VRAYAGSPLQVTVSEGAVRLEPRHAGRSERVVLTLGERGTVQADGSVLHERGVDLGPEIAWADGRLVFADMPLREAIPRLGRWYDLDVHLADARLGDLRLNATFERESASEVLHLIGLILDLRMERHGSSVVYYRKGSPP
jgi:ferric-dicitrate binding protein FerR (iron transport regulator)